VKRKAPSPRALPLSNNDVLLADRPVVRGAMPMDALFNYVLPVTKETVDEIFDGLVKENKYLICRFDQTRSYLQLYQVCGRRLQLYVDGILAVAEKILPIQGI